MSEVCPLCGRGELQTCIVDERIRHGGASLLVSAIEISVCPACKEELVLPAQAKANARRFSDAKRQHDGLLTSAQISAWRRRHSLTQQQAALLIGGGTNAFSKYERGEVIQSQAVDSLLRSVDAVPGMLAFLYARAEVAVPAARASVGYVPSNIVFLSTRRVTRTLTIEDATVDQWIFDPRLGAHG